MIYRMAAEADRSQIEELLLQAGDPPHQDITQVVVAEEDSKIVGFFYITSAILIDRLFIAPEARGGKVHVGHMIKVVDNYLQDTYKALGMPYVSYLNLQAPGREKQAASWGLTKLPFDVYMKYLEI